MSLAPAHLTTLREMLTWYEKCLQHVPVATTKWQECRDALVAVIEQEEEAENVVERVLEGKPQKNGYYLHLVYCSGDRRMPPGTEGICCCCRPSGKKVSKCSECEKLRATGMAWEFDPDGLCPECRTRLEKGKTC